MKAIIINKEYPLDIQTSPSFFNFNNFSLSVPGQSFIIRIEYNDPLGNDTNYKIPDENFIILKSSKYYSYLMLESPYYYLTKAILISKIKEYLELRSIYDEHVKTIHIMEFNKIMNTEEYMNSILSLRNVLNMKSSVVDYGDDTCCICLSKCRFNISVNSCNHKFHSECIKGLVKCHNKKALENKEILCPLCRGFLNTKYHVKFIKFRNSTIVMVYLNSNSTKVRDLIKRMNVVDSDYINDVTINEYFYNRNEKISDTIITLTKKKNLFYKLEGFKVINDLIMVKDLKI